MSKARQAWYKERFDRRILKQKLLLHGAKYWADFSEAEKAAVLEHVSDETELYFGFYGDENTWTMIGLVNVYSKYDGQFVTANLHNINGKVGIDKNEDKASILSLGFLTLEVENKRIWVPEGQAIFGLWNALTYLTDSYYYNKRPD